MNQTNTKDRIKDLLFICTLCICMTACGSRGAAEAGPVQMDVESTDFEKEPEEQEREPELSQDGQPEAELQQQTSEQPEPSEEEFQEQEQGRIEPADEHDRLMLTRLEEACGEEIEEYISLDMDQDGQNEMVGVCSDPSGYSAWYCSSDLKDCFEVVWTQAPQIHVCRFTEIEQEGATHLAVICSGNWAHFSIFGLQDGEIKVFAEDQVGYLHLNDKKDILVIAEAYDATYEKADDLWIGHTWKDTYLYYEDNKYKEYGAAQLSEQDFLKYDNAQEILDRIEQDYQDEKFGEIRYSYFVRENGIVHVQCEVEHDDPFESIWYFYYTFRENGNHLDDEAIRNDQNRNNGIMYPSMTGLEDVTYP